MNHTLSEEEVTDGAHSDMPFVLRYQEYIANPCDFKVSSGIRAGTKTMTEVRSESIDADPTTMTHLAIKRRR